MSDAESFIAVGDFSSTETGSVFTQESRYYEETKGGDHGERKEDRKEEEYSSNFEEDDDEEDIMVKQILNTLHSVLPPASVGEQLRDIWREIRDTSTTLDTLYANYRHGLCEQNNVPAIYYHSVYTATRNHYDVLVTRQKRLQSDVYFRTRVLKQIEWLQRYL